MLLKESAHRDKYIETARPILQRLEGAGFEAFLVGGCVREALRAEMQKGPARPGATGADNAPASEPAALTDIDVTTNALPEEICRVFSDLAVIETGIKHGTVTVLLPEEICRVFSDLAVIETGIKHGTVTVLLPEEDACADDPIATVDSYSDAETTGDESGVGRRAARRIPIEITTYRVDGSYSDGRHPDQVRFVTSLTEDLRRRDFTVNAMAMDLRGDLTDPFGGRADLEAGIIRAVGDPETRFREDGLRILRALRFAAVLTTNTVRQAKSAETGSKQSAGQPFETAGVCPGTQSMSRPAGFSIEPETEAALFRCAHLLEGISAERIFVELKKLICGPAAGDVIRRYADILAVIIPELAPMKNFDQHNPYHNYDVLEHCIRALETVRGVSADSLSDEIDSDSDQAPTAGPAGSAPHTAPAQSASLQLSPTDKSPTELPAPEYLKLAALLHDIGKPSTFTRDENGIGHFYGHPQVGAEMLGQVLRRLKADRRTIDRVTTLVRYHDLVFQEDDRLLKRWISRYTPQVLLEILELKRADNIATGNVSQELLDKFARIDTQIRAIIAEHDRGQTCLSIRDLAITGKDLLAAGLSEGPEIGWTMQTLVDSVIDGKIPNEREALLEAAMGSYTKNHGVIAPR